MACKRAPPPARLTAKTMNRSIEMLVLIDALPPSPEKNKIMETEQYAEWLYHKNVCMVKKYSHKPTEQEKLAGVTKDAKGNEIKLFTKGVFCHHCKCSAQDIRRHRKSKKCIKNRAKNEPHLANIRKKAGKFNNGCVIDHDASAPNLQLWIDEQKEKEIRVTDEPVKKVKKVKVKKSKKRKATDTLCKNTDCVLVPPQDGQWKKCNLCVGYFNDDGMNDVLYIEEKPNNRKGCCGLCGKTKGIVQMKDTKQYICEVGCDESEEED